LQLGYGSQKRNLSLLQRLKRGSRTTRPTFAVILREQKDRSCFSQMPVPAERAFASSRSRGQKPPDRTGLDLLVRLRAGEIQSRCATNGRQMTARPLRPRHFDKATESARQNGCVPRPQLARPHGDALRFPAFLGESRVSRGDRRTRRRSDAKLSNPTRFLAMIAIECISNSTLAACLKPFCREIILAAFLIMCNAAENFFR